MEVPGRIKFGGSSEFLIQSLMQVELPHMLNSTRYENRRGTLCFALERPKGAAAKSPVAEVHGETYFPNRDPLASFG